MTIPIELLFADAPGLEEYFVPDADRPGNCIKFQGNKVAFAKDVVAGLGAECFEHFRPIFDFVDGVIDQAK
ncbi:hypothetical protein [Primorskyibacter sp. 2E233]|uniref:hypothetical protein n=1 Tax=Primorskyibacter sp. 2E233 TaxID=3413431 RepID=UPI003BF2EA23